MFVSRIEYTQVSVRKEFAGQYEQPIVFIIQPKFKMYNSDKLMSRFTFEYKEGSSQSGKNLGSV